MTDAAWVIGAGGLLGSAVARSIPSLLPGMAPWTPSPRPFSWDRPAELGAEFEAAADAYLRLAGPQRPWVILWCAGAGVVGTPAEAMEGETRALEALLDRLGPKLGGKPGVFFLASSAGGLHGGGSEIPLTEESAPSPISDYGRAKLRQEEILARWAANHPSISTLTGRIANLYGPDQNLAKPQGLIAHISCCLLHHVPTHVFAPLDTLRDHQYAPDAAAQILACIDRLVRLPPPVRITKIIASGQTVSIGGILAIFSRIAKRQPRIICAGSSLGSLQPSRLPLRSTVWTDLRLPPQTPLPAGIRAVYGRHLELFQVGRLPLPQRRLA